MLLVNFPRIYSSSSSSPISLHNEQETVHFERSSPLSHQQQQQQQQQQPSVNLSLPSYADLTPVLHSTPLPSFETLNSNSFFLSFIA